MSNPHEGLAHAVNIARNTPVSPPQRHSSAPLFDPGILHGHPWVTTYFPEGTQTPRVSTVHHTAWVPADPSPAARYERAHELGHVQHTPTRTPAEYADDWEVHPQAVMWAEDLRINAIQHVNVDSFTNDAKAYARANSHHALAVAHLRAGNPTALMDIVGSICSQLAATRDSTTPGRYLTNYLKSLTTQLTNARFPEPIIASLTTAISNATKALHYTNIRKTHSTSSYDYTTQHYYLYSTPTAMENVTRHLAHTLNQLIPIQQSALTGPTKPRPGGCPPTDETANGWTPMVVITLPLTVSNASLLPRRKRTGWGTVLRYAYRARTDGRIFTVKRPQPRHGSYLLDASGSMCWDPDDITKHLTTLPSSTVAFYSAVDSHRLCANESDFPQGTTFQYPDNPGSLDTFGVCIIAAQNGYRATTENIYTAHAIVTGDNACDGLALRWLAQQPEPRIWYSDEGVTGNRDVSSPVLIADAHAICRTANIQIVNPQTPSEDTL